MSRVSIDFDRWKHSDIVLLDIEGTISSISFVKDTLYPYALERLTRLAHESWDEQSFRDLIAGFPEETRADAETLIAHVEELTSKDIKAVYLKQLQGKLWKAGYSTGDLKTPLYPDVLSTLRDWKSNRKRLAIFSSGSVEAQNQFFKYVETISGETEDLNGLFEAKFDTVTAGSKLQFESYEKICGELGTTPDNVVFLTDNGSADWQPPAIEALAATKAGVYSILVERPGNAVLSPETLSEFAVIHKLDNISTA